MTAVLRRPPGDTVRMCRHPVVVDHPAPPRWPVAVRNGTSMHVEWRTGPAPFRLSKCVLCGIVGELGEPV